jgi:hypothetical protein
VDDEVIIFTNMTKVVKEVVAKVVKYEGGGSRHRDDKLFHAHPDL